MIKANVRNGAIELQGPLPADWKDGRDLVIAQVAEPADGATDVEAWAEDVESAMAEIPSEDHDLFEAALAEHERESKESVRRQWGLD